MTDDESLLREMWCAYTLHATPKPFSVKEAMAAVLAVVRAHDAATVAALREALTDAAHDVLAERKRQVEAEGWTPEHDDRYDKSELPRAAGCYTLYADSYPNAGQPPPMWPWNPEWWKPKGYRRDLVRAAALLLAEIERLDRAALKGEP